jgi:hypothetical protein
MSVTLLRNYMNFASGTTITLPDDTETALIAQSFAVAAGTDLFPSLQGQGSAYVNVGGNIAFASQAGQGPVVAGSTYYQGPLNLPCISLGGVILTAFETNGVAQTAGTMNLTEIFVPFWQTWTGAGILNGTTVGTHNVLTALYGTNGALLANSAVAGVVSAGASVMQNIAYTAPITLAPGRYFLGFQYSGTTPTPRHLIAANGSNICTGTQAGTFGTVPATLTTIPVTFTTAVGPISQLYV